jgi:hypothetical protein
MIDWLSKRLDQSFSHQNLCDEDGYDYSAMDHINQNLCIGFSLLNIGDGRGA